MAYIEVHQSLRDHRKILALAEQLDMLEPHVAGHCLFLWLWSLDNAQTGVLPSARVTERVAGWQGTPGALVDAMIAVGMLDLDVDTGVISIHDWWDYAGRLIEKRREDAERKRAARAQPAPPPAAQPASPQAQPASPPVQRTSNGHPTDIQRTSARRPADVQRTVPYRTQPNTTLPNQDPDSEIVNQVCVYSADEQTVLVTKPDAEQSPPAADTHTPDKKTEKSPDVLWQTLLSPEGFGRTPEHRGREREWWDGLAQLAKTSPDGVLAPADLIARIRRYRERFTVNREGQPIPLTMRGLINNWGTLGEEQNRGPTKGPTNGTTSTTTKRKPIESDQERYTRVNAEVEAATTAFVARQQSHLAASGPTDPMPHLPGARAGPGDRMVHPTTR